MARRYKPLPAGAIVWLRMWQATAEVVADDGSAMVQLLERTRAYDYKPRVYRGRIRLATQAEADAHRLRVASIESWRRDQAEHARLLAASVTPAPADPAG